jgi:hypothetical protein
MLVFLFRPEAQLVGHSGGGGTLLKTWLNLASAKRFA